MIRHWFWFLTHGYAPRRYFNPYFQKDSHFRSSNLLNFGTTSTYHRKISNKKAVLRALPQDCLWYLTDYWPCTGKQAFLKKLSRSGHAEYSVVMASHMFQGGRPDLKEIKFILRKATEHGSDGARYFMMMLLVLSKDGSFVDDAFFIFKDLFERRQLANCKGAIMNVEGPPYFLGAFLDQNASPGIHLSVHLHLEPNLSRTWVKVRCLLAISRF